MKTTQFSIPVLVVTCSFAAYTLLSLSTAWVSYPPIVAFGIVIAVCLLMFKQTIIVTDTHVKFSQGIGLIRAKYSFEIIEDCKPISYFPFGWGIRFYPEAILFNVSGNKAIQLTFNNGKLSVWLGTQVPIELAQFINTKIHHSK